MPIAGKTQIGLDFIALLREKYTGTPKDDTERMMLELSALVEFAMDRRNPMNRVLDRIAKTLQKLFEFKTVSIGIRDDDGVYKYVALAGHSQTEDETLRKLKYSLNDMIDYDKYPNVRIGKLTQYHPVEALPIVDDELKSLGNPVLPDKPRIMLEKFLPGDYVDFLMHGYEGKVIGWFELTNTKDNKLPSRTSIRWIELIADLTALILQLRTHHEKEP